MGLNAPFCIYAPVIASPKGAAIQKAAVETLTKLDCFSAATPTFAMTAKQEVCHCEPKGVAIQKSS